MGLGAEEGIGYAQIKRGAEFEKSLPILIYLANAKMTKTTWPGGIVSSYPGIEVSQQIQVFFSGIPFSLASRSSKNASLASSEEHKVGE